MCSLCRLPVAKNHNLGQILTFGGGAPVPAPFLTMRAKFTHGKLIRLPAKLCLDRFILSSSSGENPQFLPFFGLRHLVMSPIGINLRKLSTHAQHLPTLTHAFTTYVRPLLEYATCVWSPHSVGYVKKIESVQRRF